MLRDDTEMTLRADVRKDRLQHIRLPEPIAVTDAEAALIFDWAQDFSGTCLWDGGILLNDIRPNRAQSTLGELGPLADVLRGHVETAKRHGFGLRLMRDDVATPYQFSVTRRSVDAPQLTIPLRSMRRFIETLFAAHFENNGSISLRSFVDILTRKYHVCMDAGFAHYQSHSLQVAEYGRAHGATQIVWGPERRISAN